MRVGLVIYGSLDTCSGGFLYDRKLVAYLQAHGDEVSIFSLPWRSYPGLLLQNYALSLRQRLQSAAIDVLLEDELNHPSLFKLNTQLRRNAPYPVVSIVHHLRSDENHPRWLLPLYRAVERRYLRSVDAYVCNSQATLTSVRRLSGSEQPAVVTYPGRDALPDLDATDISARAHQPGPLRLLFVGNLIPRKGLHHVLDAMTLLPAQTCTLSVVGSQEVDRGYALRVQRQAGTQRLAERIQWLGAVDTGRLQQLYASHHVLVMPSRHEGFGIVYLEGMGYGLPALASDSGGAAEWVLPGETGFLIPIGRSDELAERIRWLHGQRSELARMGESARQAAQVHPTWESSAAAIRHFLQEIIDARRKSTYVA